MPSEANGRVLVVDDNAEMSRLLSDQLGDVGYEVATACGGREGIAALRDSVFDVVITDLRMEEVDGLDVLRACRAADPTLPVLIMTAFGNVESAVEAMKQGANYYVTKPFRLEEVLLHVQRALAERRLLTDYQALRRVAQERSGFGAMIGRSEPMRALYATIERVARSDVPVLIRGESGTGKELVARALHFEGARRDATFVPVNCTSLPATLLESELFGHVRGAFTGATAARRGLFVEADGGTLFLDEIGDMATELQARLLRVLEDGEVRAVGADTVRKVDVRLIAATNRDLDRLVREGTFRADLYYRLNVVPLDVPPLRARLDDVPALVEHFLARAKQRYAPSQLAGFSPEAMAVLARRAWPGNVRELENLVQRLVIVATRSRIEPEDLAALAAGPAAPAGGAFDLQGRMVPLRQLENEYIAWVVDQCGGNKTRAAELLGIDVSTIHRRERGSRDRGSSALEGPGGDG